VYREEIWHKLGRQTPGSTDPEFGKSSKRKQQT
jgi:hypothetical protein